MQPIHSAALAVALALAAAPVHAQTDAAALDEAQVRAFFATLVEQSETAVAARDWQGLQAWLAGHVTDTAPVAMWGSVTLTGGPVSTYAIAMDGADLKALAGMAGAMQGMPPMQALSDYALDVQVTTVNPLPDGAASAAATFHETARLTPPEGQEGALPFAGVVETVSTCAFRLAAGAVGGGPQIVNAACESVTMM